MLCCLPKPSNSGKAMNNILDGSNKSRYVSRSLGINMSGNCG